MVERQEVTQRRVRFAAGGVELDGIVHIPRGDGPFPAAVVCHPHPLYGGDMHNNVVVPVCQALAEASIAALRFNFRGVGGGQGAHGDGIGEQEDVISALGFLESTTYVDAGRIGVVGYSFGAMVALPAALRHGRCRALALVSPFLDSSGWDQLRSYDGARFLLCGTEDTFISCREAHRWAKEMTGRLEFHAMAGADHFWWGFEDEVARRVAGFLKVALGAGTG
ncbi:MAG: prolyl oligopeptidase family serine peptidase [Chloroflexi bacterium]|nr:prolyl oligopeptidase family serine peptidase [Chloroflexota bacterium]